MWIEAKSPADQPKNNHHQDALTLIMSNIFDAAWREFIFCFPTSWIVVSPSKIEELFSSKIEEFSPSKLDSALHLPSWRSGQNYQRAGCCFLNSTLSQLSHISCRRQNVFHYNAMRWMLLYVAPCWYEWIGLDISGIDHLAVLIMSQERWSSKLSFASLAISYSFFLFFSPTLGFNFSLCSNLQRYSFRSPLCSRIELSTH